VSTYQVHVGKKNMTLEFSGALKSIQDKEEEIIKEDNIRKQIISK
jgi:two-component system sensor histidine kinase VicK